MHPQPTTQPCFIVHGCSRRFVPFLNPIESDRSQALPFTCLYPVCFYGYISCSSPSTHLQQHYNSSNDSQTFRSYILVSAPGLLRTTHHVPSMNNETDIGVYHMVMMNITTCFSAPSDLCRLTTVSSIPLSRDRSLVKLEGKPCNPIRGTCLHHCMEGFPQCRY